MDDIVLSVRNLDKFFPAGGTGFGKPRPILRALDGVSFDVRRGETFGIVGESGSGKTTLGRCIMRVMEPNGGEVVFRRHNKSETEICGATPATLRDVWRDLRMVFQDPQSSLNPRLRVLEIIGQVLRKTESLSGKALEERVAELLVRVGLRPEFMMRYPNAFSGGQRQRLGIARALATNPELVIADEAVSALDVSIQAQTLNLMQDLQDEFGLTYLFIAHDLAVVEHFCDRVGVMYRGQIVELAETEELFSNPCHPYTRALLEAVPIPDPKARKPRRSAARTVDTNVVDLGCRFVARCPFATDLCRTRDPMPKIIGGTQVLCHHAGEI